jgi:hypothetical protein
LEELEGFFDLLANILGMSSDGKISSALINTEAKLGSEEDLVASPRSSKPFAD